MPHNILLTLALGTLLFVVISVTVVIIAINSQKRHIAHLLEQSASRHNYEQQLLQSRLETQEQSFQYFSEEIHDNVGQLLSVVGMYLYQLEMECGYPESQELAAKGSELLNKALKDLRSISHSLNAQYINNAGLEESLRQEIDYINAVKEGRCKLFVSGTPQTLLPEHQVLLFRILQEAIGNALKHANASEIAIGIDFLPDLIMATVRDNGRGIDKTEHSTQKGLGLLNMKIRAALLGCALEVESTLTKGTNVTLRISLPIKQSV